MKIKNLPVQQTGITLKPGGFLPEGSDTCRCPAQPTSSPQGPAHQLSPEMASVPVSTSRLRHYQLDTGSCPPEIQLRFKQRCQGRGCAPPAACGQEMKNEIPLKYRSLIALTLGSIHHI